MKSDRQLQELSIFVHGVLTGLHILGIAYNLKKRNWGDVAAHTAAAGYDLWAVNKHIGSLRECEQQLENVQ